MRLFIRPAARPRNLYYHGHLRHFGMSEGAGDVAHPRGPSRHDADRAAAGQSLSPAPGTFLGPLPASHTDRLPDDRTLAPFAAGARHPDGTPLSGVPASSTTRCAPATPHDDGTCSRLEYEDEAPLDLIAGGQGRTAAGTHRSADVALWVLVGLFLIGAVCALVASEEVGGAVSPAKNDDAAFGANDEHRIR